MNKKLSLVLVLLIAALFFSRAAFSEDDKGSPGKGAAVSANDPVEKAMFHIRSAEEKMARIKSKMSEGNAEGLESLTAEYEQDIKGARDNVDKARALGRDATFASEVVEKATARHIEVLNEVLNRVPDRAKSAIRHAIEVSGKGRQRALENLQGQEDKPERVKPEKIRIPEARDELEGIREPRGIDKPRGHEGSHPHKRR